MKKTLIIIGVIAAILISGFFIIKGNKKPSALKPSFENEPQTVNEEQPINVSSFTIGESVICEYSVEGVRFTSYIKERKIKTVTVLPNGDINNSLFVGDKVYQWSEKEKQGFYMTIEEAKKQPGTEIQDPDEYIKSLSLMSGIKCNKANIPDSTFAVPKDIKFADLSKLLNP